MAAMMRLSAGCVDVMVTRKGHGDGALLRKRRKGGGEEEGALAESGRTAVELASVAMENGMRRKEEVDTSVAWRSREKPEIRR